ncbi:NUDIX domain-containing protein [Lysobacter sp. KIS68-7]|uniref:NUDIX domain-containing protein n=1 Tax=Lysobacter sp. KIS68-7 TaxID=2904252 RepID=UPI001E638AC6|nr:NUDIX domain-containing protein [Lysobacter sp. KIS68-7]UHQ19293.1 NUDIX domain-containing protein [Lysobacter sp. KIS68-7]
MPERSCGLLLYRRDPDALRVLVCHPGGPFWRNRDAGAWTLPKGAPEGDETAEATALREFAEELGTQVSGTLQPLGRIRQKGGKWVEAFALEGDFDPSQLHSNPFECEWPPRSGKVQAYPEIDRATWATLEQARVLLLPAQCEFLDRLAALLAIQSAAR